MPSYGNESLYVLKLQQMECLGGPEKGGHIALRLTVETAWTPVLRNRQKPAAEIALSQLTRRRGSGDPVLLQEQLLGSNIEGGHDRFLGDLKRRAAASRRRLERCAAAAGDSAAASGQHEMRQRQPNDLREARSAQGRVLQQAPA
jgi:hypothetical protein